MGDDALWFGVRFLSFHKTMPLSSWTTSSERLLQLLDHEDRGTKVYYNCMNHSANATASHPRRLPSTATSPYDPSILHCMKHI
jgi:hypothetical protein